MNYTNRDFLELYLLEDGHEYLISPQYRIHGETLSRYILTVELSMNFCKRSRAKEPYRASVLHRNRNVAIQLFGLESVLYSNYLMVF